jgi:hypothetical protein
VNPEPALVLDRKVEVPTVGVEADVDTVTEPLRTENTAVRASCA